MDFLSSNIIEKSIKINEKSNSFIGIQGNLKANYSARIFFILKFRLDKEEMWLNRVK
jgi:hypothetical protein